MKKKIHYALILMLSIALIACCYKGEPTPPTPPGNNGPIFEQGIHPVQIGTMIFEYNPDYSIALFGNGPYAKATYDPFEINNIYEDQYKKSLFKVSDVSFNELGKITYFKSEFSYFYYISNYDDFISIIGTHNTYLDYNSEGRLTHFSGSATYKDFDNIENNTFSADYQWNAGNLHKVVITANLWNNDQITTTYTFEYGDLKNELKQYVSTIYEMELSESFFDNDDIGGLVNLKLFGNPSEYFVTKVTSNCTVTDSEGTWSETVSANYTYTFNDDKTLKSYTEIYHGEEYSDTTTWDCIFTDDYSVTPDIQEESRTVAHKMINPRKSTLFKRNKH